MLNGDIYYEDLASDKSSARGLINDELLSFRMNSTLEQERAFIEAAEEKQINIENERTPELKKEKKKNYIRPGNLITKEPKEPAEMVSSKNSSQSIMKMSGVRSPLREGESPELRQKPIESRKSKNILDRTKERGAAVNAISNKKKNRPDSSPTSPTKFSLEKLNMGDSGENSNFFQRIKNIFTKEQQPTKPLIKGDTQIGASAERTHITSMVDLEESQQLTTESLEKKFYEDSMKSKRRKELANAVIKLFREKDWDNYDDEYHDTRGDRLQRLEDIIEYDQKLGGIKESYPLMVRKMTDLEKINYYEDDLPLLGLRKKIYRFNK